MKQFPQVELYVTIYNFLTLERESMLAMVLLLYHTLP